MVQTGMERYNLFIIWNCGCNIIWFHITPMVSDLLIGLCAIMMVVSVVLYIIKNTRTLKGETV